MISLLPRSSPVKPPRTSSSTSPASESESTPLDQRLDAFQHPETLAKAELRWGLGSTPTEFSPIVHPQGRPGIADLVDQMRKIRISSGIIRQRSINKNDDNNSLSTATTGPRNKFEKATPNQHLHKPLYGQLQEEAPLWLKHKVAIVEKLSGKRWNPVKKITRQSMEEIRYLHKQFPDEWTTPKLADHFNIASESVRRILKNSNFVPAPERAQKQDDVRTVARKTRVAERLAQNAEAGRTLYLQRKARMDQQAALYPQKKFHRFQPVASNPVNSTATDVATPVIKARSAPRIKLGAPKRSIE
ncbi:Required for respiratory growth protein 9 mitochondrial [Gryganskiella cystojenkinii]|nr:Required for respiratory growth protein 9 mitochondrial [Gryganskiella cystojenkinii]